MLTLNPDGTTTCGSTIVDVQATTLDGVTISIEGSDSSLAEVLDEGDYIEVEILSDGGMAENAVEVRNSALASSGLPENVSSQGTGALPRSTHQAAEIVLAQGSSGGARGTSGPASSGQTRLERTIEAVGRAVSSVARSVIPGYGHARMRVQTKKTDGTLTRDVHMDITIGSQGN